MELLSVVFAPVVEPAINSLGVPEPSGEVTSTHLVTHPFTPLSEPEFGPQPAQEAPSAETPTAEPPPQASPNPTPQYPQAELISTSIDKGMPFQPVPGSPPLSVAAAQPLNLTSYLFVTGANLLPLTAAVRAGIEHGISSALLPVHSNTSPQVTVTEMVNPFISNSSSISVQISDINVPLAPNPHLYKHPWNRVVDIGIDIAALNAQESPAAGRRKVLQIKIVDTVNLKVVVQTIVVDAPDIQLQLKGAVLSGLLVSAIRSQGKRPHPTLDDSYEGLSSQFIHLLASVSTVSGLRIEDEDDRHLMLSI